LSREKVNLERQSRVKLLFGAATANISIGGLVQYTSEYLGDINDYGGHAGMTFWDLSSFPNGFCSPKRFELSAEMKKGLQRLLLDIQKMLFFNLHQLNLARTVFKGRKWLILASGKM